VSFTPENAARLVRSLDALIAADERLPAVALPSEDEAPILAVLNSEDWRRAEEAYGCAASAAEQCGLGTELPSHHKGVTLLYFIRAAPPEGLERFRVLRDAASIVAEGRPPGTLRELWACLAAARSNGLVREQLLKSVSQRRHLEHAVRDLLHDGYAHLAAESVDGLVTRFVAKEGLAKGEAWGMTLPEAARLLAQGDVQWSAPDTVEGWSRRFGLSRNTMSKRLRHGTFRCRQCGRLWQIDASQVPAKK
jgi:hypothetical protein